MVRSIIDIRPPQFSYVVYYMVQDGKRQAGAAGFLHHRSMTPVPELSYSVVGRFVATAIKSSSRRQNRPFKLVRRYTVCYRAKNDDGKEAHGRTGKVAAIPGRTQRKQCPASCFRHARPSDECVLQRRDRRTRRL